MDEFDRWLRHVGHAREVRLKTQETRWWAARARQRARLLRLKRFMPEANRLTLVVTAALLAQRGLLAEQAFNVPPSTARRRSNRAQWKDTHC